MKICVYAISKNEEMFVKRFCDSAKDADLILIADTGSTDDTVKLAKKHGAKVSPICITPWRFDDARNAALALIPERLDAWATEPRAFLKFVIASPADVEEVLALHRRYRFRPERVFLMAEGTDSTTLRARQAWLSDLCLKHGFRMSDRLHIHLYGDTRGT